MTQDLIQRDTLTTLTLRELHERLNTQLAHHGHGEIAYSTLSELLNVGDVAQQLQIGGTGNARCILPEVADVLAAFLPVYRTNKGRLPQAAQMLRAFLQLAQSNALTVTEFAVTPKPEAQPVVDALAVAEAQGRAQGLAQREQVMTPQEAAAFLQISVRMLNKTRKPSLMFGTQARYLLSDLVQKTG